MRESDGIEGIETDRGHAEARIGTTIDRSWRLDALLGIGGMAAVYAASHVSGRRGAFKVMHARIANDAQLVTRFVREQSIAAKVRHPACIDIHGAGTTDDGVPLLAMELLEGETLDARLARIGRLPVGDALGVGERLLDFLVACHGAGVVHRDLKPANIFLLHEARIKVIDFGFARESSRSITSRRMAIGTAPYMSPEQARGASDVDLRSDLFAVGAILYRALVGHGLPSASAATPLPEGAPTPLPEDRPPPSDPLPSIATAAPRLDAVLARAIDRALSWQRNERWGSADAMLAELRTARSSIPPSQLAATVETDEEEDEDEGSARKTDPGTPSAIRVLQDPEHAARTSHEAPRPRSS
jgi:eukaryotic-like serine/threonine-protein kinase